MAERRRRARSFGTARRLPSGRWQVRYYDQAGVRHTAPRTFPSKAAANRYLAQVEADLLRGSWTDPRLARITSGEGVERWWPTIADLRPGTPATCLGIRRRSRAPGWSGRPRCGMCRSPTTKELMERMGHTSPAVALRYQHVMADRQGAVAAALDALSAMLRGRPAPEGTWRARRSSAGSGKQAPGA